VFACAQANTPLEQHPRARARTRGSIRAEALS
jgi:hypothetical protein